MRPKRLGRCCAGSRLGPGDPAALTCAPSPSASPAPEPSAQPQARGTGQRVGSRATSGSQFLSEARTGARPASEAGAKAGARRPSAFSAIQGDVRSMPDNSDAPWTRFVFQGPFGSRATGRGTGKAAGIWKTPAAYVGRRPGVSGPERAAFIRELEEALCPNLPPPVKKITQEDVKVMLYLLEELLPPVWESVTYGMVLQRERDLNTAARIGQSLVKQNSVLMEENSKLEALLGSAKEEILYLRHQVNLRDELLQLYSDSDEEDEDEEEEEEEKEAEEEQEEEEAEEDLQCAHPCDAPKLISQEALLHQHHCPQLEALQEKLRLLEEENHQLREEASQLDTLEDEEQMLILECVEQFSEASQQMAELSEVLVLRLENYERQQQEVARLQAQVLKLQQRCRMDSLMCLGRLAGSRGCPEWVGLRWGFTGFGSFQYGAETEKLQKQLASEKEIQMQLQEEETLPGFQETLAEELRTSLRRMISDPVYFMERNYEMPRGDTSSLRYDFRYSEDREQVRGFEAEEGLMLAADIMRGEDFTPAEEFVPQEELGAAKKVPAEEGVMEEAELVSEETEGWEEVELELDEATRMNVVTSALEASGLGPSHLDMNYVLQQLANWQDAHYRRQLRWKMLQKEPQPRT
ncbi:huntingtin-associated protein 1 isoform 5 [Homo sapiens]|nr:huntingtin-associated protein 1 isoform 5 [Homo sapiens]